MLFFRTLLIVTLKAVDILMMLAGLFLVPFGIRYGFTGLLWPWGNDDHPDQGGEFWRSKCGVNWWCAYQWFALRNPAFNWGKYVLGIRYRPYSFTGDGGIGDKKKGGWYWCTAGIFSEFYWIKPYTLFGSRRCIRVRFGWKLYGKTSGDTCQFCGVINPVMPYSGI